MYKTRLFTAACLLQANRSGLCSYFCLFVCSHVSTDSYLIVCHMTVRQSVVGTQQNQQQ